MASQVSIEGAEEGQARSQGSAGGEEETGTVMESDIDMEGDEGALKIPRRKRKTKSKNGSSQAKKGAANMRKGSEEARSGSDMEVDCADSQSSDFKAGSQSSARKYSVRKIKVFLQKTKNMKGVKVEDYFSDEERFAKFVRMHMSSEDRGGLINQEVYRLRKIVQKINNLS